MLFSVLFSIIIILLTLLIDELMAGFFIDMESTFKQSFI